MHWQPYWPCLYETTASPAALVCSNRLPVQNYDEFASLKALQEVDLNDPAAVEDFKAKHYLSDEDLQALQAITLPAERKVQDYPLYLQRCA